MRGTLTWVCLAAAPLLGCGFDTTTPTAQQNSTSGSSSGGVPATSGGVPATSGGPSSGGGTAGQPASSSGAGGMPITPTGGSGALGGAAGVGGGGAGGSNGGSGGIASGGASGSGGAAGGGGTAGSGGTTGGSGGAGGGGTVDPQFKLAWRDDFDTFDATRWTKQTHTFAENLARFSAANAVVEGGLLKLKVTHVQNQDKAYTAAEVATKDLFTFGRFAGRIKFCPGSGMVSSLFTYHDDVNTSWQEIDIEHLGNMSKSVQYNLITGTLAQRVYQPKVVNFQFSPPADFHEYVIEWKPDAVTFFVDGTQTYRTAQSAIKDSARLHMNAWPTDNTVTTFAGTFDPGAVPCEADYDWIEAYTYVP